MTYIHNWFERDYVTKDWEVVEGALDLPHLKEGQYFRIVGSVFNDGLHENPASDLKDEKFTGTVWGLAIPHDFVALVEDIEAWEGEYGKAALSPYASESFENYSYSKSSDATSKGNADPASGWQRAFMARLIPYRKLG